MFVEIINHRREGARQVNIVAVEISHYIASDLFNTLVESMRLPPIFFAHPIGKLAFIFANYVDASVAAPAIDDDEL